MLNCIFFTKLSRNLPLFVIAYFYVLIAYKLRIQPHNVIIFDMKKGRKRKLFNFLVYDTKDNGLLVYLSDSLMEVAQYLEIPYQTATNALCRHCKVRLRYEIVKIPVEKNDEKI